MLETPGRQVQKLLRHRVLVVTLGVSRNGPVLLFLVTRCVCCVLATLTEPSLDLYPGACAWWLLQSLQELGWKSGSEL